MDSIAEALPGYAALEFTFIYRLLTPVFIVLPYFKDGGSLHERFLDSPRPPCFG